MNSVVRQLILLLISCFAVTGCLTLVSMPEQVTSLNTGCNPEEMKILNEVVNLNGEQTWTAKCGGRSYNCSYFPEVDSNCYEVDE